MPVSLKPLAEQVVLITGATSGIGLSTAERAAAAGARVVLVARNEEALHAIADGIAERGGDALPVMADVARAREVEHAAEVALSRYGRIDTWVNNAGVAVYGTAEEVSLADHRRVFDVNYWGVVHGSLAAVKAIRERGGAIVNLGSILSDMTVVLQAPYCATKHAVKAFTNTLRLELEAEGVPISVTLIKPSAIDTPFFEHARSYLDEPGIRNPPPAYDSELVADAILFAAEHPRRTLSVGFGGFATSLLATHFPRLTDKLIESTGFAMQVTDEPGRPARRDNLYAPREDGARRSALPGGRRETSLFLEAQKRPLAVAAALAGLGAGIVGLLASRRRAPSEEARLARREGLARVAGV
ncbi:MAG: SDR family NAD(P)-dependent oxidoreductase [Methylobacteriaceae bacterium]|nr:SDR family NAD(P)-dependent oxidoreductase [Methylobacteriaceae bacterium]